MLKPLMAILESTPTAVRAADEALTAGAKLAQEALDLMPAAQKSVAKFEPVYQKEGFRFFLSEQKLERIKMCQLITSTEVQAPQIKLFAKRPPQITMPPGISDKSKAEAILVADYANTIHWDAAARAAVSTFEQASKSVSSQRTTIAASGEQMEQLALEGASGFIHGVYKNKFSDYLANNFGRYTHERLYWARSEVLRGLNRN